jgi:Berberine and berberine like
VMALMCYAGDIEAGERAIAPFKALTEPLADLIRQMPYPEIYRLFGDEEAGPTGHETVRSYFVDSVDGRGAEAVIDHLEATTADIAVAQLRVLGGAMARVPRQATAFAHRERRVMVALGALYERAEDTPEHEAWVRSLAAALSDGAPGVYVNFLADEGEDRVREAYPGSTWERLAVIKGRYDPTNLFRLNQNITPGS